MVQSYVKVKKLGSDITHLRRRGKIVIGVGLLILLVGGFLAGSQFASDETEISEEKQDQVPVVSLASVEELSKEVEPLRAIGEVSSVAEAAVRAESQGRITSVARGNGDAVARGDVVMRLENSSQVAALRQAEAALASQQAVINRTQTISTTNLDNAERQLREAQASTINSLESQYNQAREAVLSQADTLFSNPLSDDPRLLFTIPTNQQEKNRLEDDRLRVGKALSDWEKSLQGITSDDLTDNRFAQIEDYIDEANQFLNRLSAAASSLQASENVSAAQISSWKAAAGAARSTVAGLPGSLNALQTSLAQTETSLSIAREEAAQASLEESSTAFAGLRQAESAVEAAQVALSKTIIRAPISGVVSGLALKEGDVVAPLQEVFTVSSDAALEVKTYVIENERAGLSVGAEVFIGSERQRATITRIAPVVNPNTRKIEITVIPQQATGLIDGQSVALFIPRGDTRPETPLVPLSALKVLPEGFALFELDGDTGTARAIMINVGPIVGDKVVVREGVDFDTIIITDVRGISDGDSVEISDSLETSDE